MPRNAPRLRFPPLRVWIRGSVRLGLSVLVCGVLVGCERHRDVGVSPAAESSARAASAPAPLRQPASPQVRKLVKTVDLDLRVADTTASAETLQALASELGGYVGEMDAQRRGDLLFYTMTLRIPADRLDDATERIKRIAERIDREVVRSEDVTEQHIDLTARLKTLQATETELRELLSESRSRDRKAEDVMAIYAKLMEIRSGIEQLQGQLEALEKLTALSTINVRLSPTESAMPVVSDRWHPGQTVRRSVRALLMTLRVLGDLVILVVIVLLPIGLAIALSVWGLARVWKAIQRKRSSHP